MEKQILALDSTQIATWLSCHRKWKLAFQELLVPISEASAFSTGKLVHRMLEVYYRYRQLGISATTAGSWALDIVSTWLKTGACTTTRTLEPQGDEWNMLEKLTKDWAPEVESQKPVKPEDWLFLSKRFFSYYNYFASENFIVKDVEVGFSVPILETTTEFYVLEGRIDLLLQDVKSGDLYWVDHKTQSREYKFYSLTPQFLNYCLALGTRHGLINIFGLQKSEPKQGFFPRQHILISPEMLREWKFDIISTFAEVSAAKRHGNFKKNRVECKHGLNRQCSYTHICEQAHPVFEAEVKRLEFKQREPWSPWRVSDDEAED